MKKYIVISALSLLCVVGLIISFVNGNFDIVKSAAVTSFNNLLISGLEKNRSDQAWIISMPDKTSKLTLKTDDSNTSVDLTLDIRPFLKAGMDVNKLPSYMDYNLNKNELYIINIYGTDKITGDDIAIDNMYNNIIINYRDKLSYHHTLGHFGLSLDNGNAFEYAQDIYKNDKDIVIALNPKTFEDANVDVSKVEGYKYADVAMDDGNTIKKLLKIFNLEEVNKCLTTSKGC